MRDWVYVQDTQRAMVAFDSDYQKVQFDQDTCTYSNDAHQRSCKFVHRCG